MFRTLAPLFLLTMLVLAFGPPATADERYLIVNVGDGDDQEAADAASKFDPALDMKKPDAIDGDAESYYVRLPEGATIQALDGVAQRKGAGKPSSQTGAVSVSERADAATSAADEGPTGWIELEASVASVFYWSPDGEGESSWRRDRPSLFIRRLADETVVVFMGEPGTRPSDAP